MTEELWRKEQDEFNKNVEKNTLGATEFYLSEEEREKSLKIKAYAFVMPDKEAIGNAEFIKNIPKQRGFLGVSPSIKRGFFFPKRYTLFYYDTLDNARKARNEFILNNMRVGNVYPMKTKEND